MMIQKTLLSFLFAFQPISEQFQQAGYVEICNHEQTTETFDALYASFDAFIEFLQKKPALAQKLYAAKERFIRSKERSFYSTDIFGLYDESKKEARSQISFYYSTHFHEFICAHYPELNRTPEIAGFLEACCKIQTPCAKLFNEAAVELGLEHFPILLKIIKYLPSYAAARPHYDGSAFSLFLHSTDNESLLFSPYKPSLAIEDFSCALRELNSALLIPGTLLTEFSIYPTPHIVTQSGKTRYATIAFAMRPHHSFQKVELAPLPNFKD